MFHHFRRDERGTISLDWMVVSAALVLLTLSLGLVLRGEGGKIAIVGFNTMIDQAVQDIGTRDHQTQTN